MTNITTIEGTLTPIHKKYAIITSRFNELITSKLEQGAIDCLVRHGVSEKNIIKTFTPGAFELPLIAKKFAQKPEISAVICLGAVIRGATSHYDYVCSEVAKGLSKVALDEETPTIFGVLTTDNLDQALERSGAKSGNKGWEAALAALEMSSLMEKINS